MQQSFATETHTSPMTCFANFSRSTRRLLDIDFLSTRPNYIILVTDSDRRIKVLKFFSSVKNIYAFSVAKFEPTVQSRCALQSRLYRIGRRLSLLCHLHWSKLLIANTSISNSLPQLFENSDHKAVNSNHW